MSLKEVPLRGPDGEIIGTAHIDSETNVLHGIVTDEKQAARIKKMMEPVSISMTYAVSEAGGPLVFDLSQSFGITDRDMAMKRQDLP